MTKVFVFGTAKKGFPLHKRGLRNATYLGEYKTLEHYPMMVAGPWFAPMMLDRPGVGHQVIGELYEIKDSQMPALDKLESVGQPGNFRKLVQVEELVHGDICWAYVYMKSPALTAPMRTGYLSEYQDRRYIPPARRAG